MVIPPQVSLPHKERVDAKYCRVLLCCTMFKVNGKQVTDYVTYVQIKEVAVWSTDLIPLPPYPFMKNCSRALFRSKQTPVHQTSRALSGTTHSTICTVGGRGTINHKGNPLTAASVCKNGCHTLRAAAITTGRPDRNEYLYVCEIIYGVHHTLLGSYSTVPYAWHGNTNPFVVCFGHFPRMVCW